MNFMKAKGAVNVLQASLLLGMYETMLHCAELYTCVRACLRVCECLRVRKLINEWGKVSIVFLIRKGFSTHTCMSSIFFYNVLSSVLHDWSNWALHSVSLLFTDINAQLDRVIYRWISTKATNHSWWRKSSIFCRRGVWIVICVCVRVRACVCVCVHTSSSWTGETAHPAVTPMGTW